MQKPGKPDENRGISVASHFDCLKTVYNTEPKPEAKKWTYKLRFNDYKRINLDLEEEFLSKKPKHKKDASDPSETPKEKE